MDVEELWGCRVNTSRHLSYAAAVMQPSRLNSESPLTLDDSEGDDVTRACFQCPFCYVDIEVPLLCTHLQEEHCFDTKNAVCPMCAENLGKDMIGHFTMEHPHMLKRRKPQRTSLWTNTPSMLGKEMHGVSSFLGVTINNRGNARDSSEDPRFSPFICSVSFPDTKGDQKVNCETDARVDTFLHESSVEPSTSDKAQEQDYEERSQRAEFLQQVLISTIF